MTEHLFARTCSCGKRVPPGQRCDCKPPPKATPEEMRPTYRRGYKTAAYRQARKAAIARATYAGTIRCEGCGRDLERGEYETHHVDGNPEHNEASNLRVVCHGCHRRMEAQRRRSERR